MSGFLFYEVGHNPNLPRIQQGCQVEGSVYKINRDVTTKKCQMEQTCIIRWEIMSTRFIDKLHNMIIIISVVLFHFDFLKLQPHLGVNSLLQPCGSWGSNSDSQACQQRPFTLLETSPFFFPPRQCFSVQPWLSWNSLCRPGWARTQKSPASASQVLKLKECATTTQLVLVFGFWFCFLSETGFLCVALAVLEPTLQTRLASNSEIHLPLPPESWD